MHVARCGSITLMSLSEVITVMVTNNLKTHCMIVLRDDVAVVSTVLLYTAFVCV